MKINAPRKGLFSLTFAAAVAILLNACFVTSVRPYYFPSDAVDVPELVGRWGAGEDEVWTLEPSGDAYLWRVAQDDEEEYTLEATFFNFQGALLVDVRLGEKEYGADENVEIHTLRTHTVARVKLEDGELDFDLLSSDFLKRALESGATDVGHYESPDDRLVLTGSTTELQGYLAWCLAQPGCFDESEDSPPMKRLGGTPG